MEIDFAKGASDYGLHYAVFPDAFFDRIVKDLCAQAGQRAPDPGTGPGTKARRLASRGCDITRLASRAPDAVTQFNGELRSLRAKKFSRDPLPAPHRAWAATTLSS